MFQILPALLIVLQLMVPPGTMPTTASAGWMLSLCPDQFGVIFTTPTGHHHHHQHHHHDHEAANAADDARSLANCAFAVLAGDLASETPPALPLAPVEQVVQTFWRLERATPRERRYTQPVRGPPSYLRLT